MNDRNALSYQSHSTLLTLWQQTLAAYDQHNAPDSAMSYLDQIETAACQAIPPNCRQAHALLSLVIELWCQTPPDLMTAEDQRLTTMLRNLQQFLRQQLRVKKEGVPRRPFSQPSQRPPPKVVA